ncbi:MAG: lipopolysaccharide biosynthesis protein [Geobacter sp.]|nr:MAG: lipopolysaccharide biosynthesis protein [Geobacter sp.]
MSDIYPIEQQTEATCLRGCLSMFFKHKVMILTLFLSVTALVAIAVLLTPPVYLAKSSVLVKIGREYLNDPEVGQEKKLMTVNMLDIIKTEIQILTSRELAEKVVSNIKIDRLYPSLAGEKDALQKAVAQFQKNVVVEEVKHSSVITVSFRHTDPQIAASAVNMLVELYNEKHLQVFSSPRSSFLDQQLSAYQQQLKSSEKNFEEFKQKNQVFSLEEQRTLLLQQRMSLDTTLKDAQNRVDELSKKLATLSRQNKLVAQDKNLNSPSDFDRVVGETRSKLLALQLEEQQLLKKYNENSRMVVNIRKEIDLVKAFLKGQEEELQIKQKTGNSIFQQVRMDLMKTEAELNSQRARVGTVRGQLNQVDGQIQSLDRNAQLFQSLKRDVATTEKNYLTYQNKAEEARLSEDMNRLKLANVSVIQPAVAPSAPASVSKLFGIIAGCFAGAVLAIGSAFLVEIFSPIISTPAIAEKRLCLPVLASLPYNE